MTLKELEKEWKALQKDIPAKILSVAGTNLPHVSLCSNFIQLAGRAIALSNLPGKRAEENKGYEKAREVLRKILFIELPAETKKIRPDVTGLSQSEKNKKLIMMRAELFAKFYNDLTQAYVNLMTAEAQLGCVRVPVQLHHMHQDTKVQSNYGDWQINYSPMLNEVVLTGANAIEETARLFATAYIKEEPLSVITVRCNKAIRPRDYLRVQSVISEFCEISNAYAQEEFESKQDDVGYQHRFDDDPSTY